MTLFGVCWSPGDGAISVAALRLLRRILGPHTILRTGPDLSYLFPVRRGPNFFGDPSAEKYTTVCDEIVANCQTTGVEIYWNSGNIPAHASGGVPLYQTGVGGSAAWWLYAQTKLSVEQIERVFDLARTDFDPPKPGDPPPWIQALRIVAQPDPNDAEFKRIHEWHFDAEYRKEMARTWAWNEPLKGGGAWHVWGDPAFAAADRISAPRLWLANRDLFLKMLIDTAWLNEAARQQMLRWGRAIRYAGFGNEFGGTAYNIDMRFDRANNPDDTTAPDTVKTRLGPALNAYYSGLWDVFDGEMVGFEADGSDILRRCSEENRMPDIITWHFYGPDGATTIGAMDRFRNEFRPQLDRLTGGVGEGVGEAGDDNPFRLIQSIGDLLRERPQTRFVITLKPQYWIDGDVTTDDVRESKAGAAMREFVLRHRIERRRAVRSA